MLRSKKVKDTPLVSINVVTLRWARLVPGWVSRLDVWEPGRSRLLAQLLYGYRLVAVTVAYASDIT